MFKFLKSQYTKLKIWLLIRKANKITKQLKKENKHNEMLLCQRRSFVYGNARLSNSEISVELVNEVAEELRKNGKEKS